MTLRQLAAELSAADPHWNVEPLLRAADALEWIATRPTSPNDPGPHADWWDLYRAAWWALGRVPDHPASQMRQPCSPTSQS